MLGLLVALAVAGPLVALPLSFVGGVGPTTLALLPPALGRSVLLGVGVAAGTLRAGRCAGRPRVVLGLPRPPAARPGARAAAGDAVVRAGVRAGRPARPGQPAAEQPVRRPGAARAARAGRRDRGAVSRPLSLRLPAGPQRVPRAVAPGAGGRPHTRPRVRPGGVVCRGAAGPARARCGRRAGRDGGAGRLRRGQPAGLPDADRCDLPRLVRGVRRGRGPAAGVGAGEPGAADGRRRAGAARAGPLPPGAAPRRRRHPPPPARLAGRAGRDGPGPAARGRVRAAGPAAGRLVGGDGRGGAGGRPARRGGAQHAAAGGRRRGRRRRDLHRGRLRPAGRPLAAGQRRRPGSRPSATRCRARSWRSRSTCRWCGWTAA